MGAAAHHEKVNPVERYALDSVRGAVHSNAHGRCSGACLTAR
jgi:hypothetical protein